MLLQALHMLFRAIEGHVNFMIVGQHSKIFIEGALWIAKKVRIFWRRAGMIDCSQKGRREGMIHCSQNGLVIGIRGHISTRS